MESGLGYTVSRGSHSSKAYIIPSPSSELVSPPVPAWCRQEIHATNHALG